ncbi:MAG TPA: LysE family transporter [Kofleriaceae bacterium]|nr:LysE family transporter [Kofleriaceae bacterium]
MLTYFLIGAALGAVTGVPIGPLNVAIIDAAYRHHLRRAIAVALGGAVADLLYASLGILGLGQLLTAHAIVPPILYTLSGVVLIIYGILTVRAQPVDPGVAGQSDLVGRSYFWGGFGMGLALILLNPATLITWVVIVGSAMSDANQSEGMAAAIGIGCGSAFWFTTVAYLADHGKKLLGKKTVILTRIVGVALICYGVFSIGRAGWYVYRSFLS